MRSTPTKSRAGGLESGFQIPATYWMPVVLLMAWLPVMILLLNIYSKTSALAVSIAAMRSLQVTGGGRYEKLYTQRELQEILRKDKRAVDLVAKDFNDKGERIGYSKHASAWHESGLTSLVHPASIGGVGDSESSSENSLDTSASSGTTKEPDPYQWRNISGSTQGKKILIDVGANCGNSYKKLVNMNKWQRKRPWDRAYLFEWNPRIIRLYLNKLAKQDPRVVLIPNPAWGEDRNMTFYMDTRDQNLSDQDYLNRYPCTTKVNTFNSPEDSGTMLKGYGRAGQPVEVFAVGFPSWFLKQDDITREDLLYIKIGMIMVRCRIDGGGDVVDDEQIDIEGAECSVIDAWMDAGLTCIAQEYYVEWHDVFTPEVKECATKTRNRLIELAGKCEHNVVVSVW